MSFFVSTELMPKSPTLAAGAGVRANAPRAAKSGHGQVGFFPGQIEGSYVCFHAGGSPQHIVDRYVAKQTGNRAVHYHR